MITIKLKKYVFGIVLLAHACVANSTSLDAGGEAVWKWQSHARFQEVYKMEVLKTPSISRESWVSATDHGVLKREVAVAGNRWLYIQSCMESKCEYDNMSILYSSEKERLYGLIYRSDGNGQHFNFIGDVPSAFRAELFRLHIHNFKIVVHDQAGLAIQYMYGLNLRDFK